MVERERVGDSPTTRRSSMVPRQREAHEAVPREASSCSTTTSVAVGSSSSTRKDIRMPLYHFFSDARRTPPRLGVSKSNPPVTGGTVIDSFVHDDAPLAELRRMAERRNTPLRIEWRDGLRWQPQGEGFAVTPMGLEAARQVAIGLAALRGTARIVTNRARVIWEWEPGRDL